MLQHIANMVRHAARDLTTGSKRSPHWPAVERRWIKNNPMCAACGGAAHVQAHHRRPFHLFPEEELADGNDGRPCNLISLCVSRECWAHLHLGHGGDFRAWNPNVEQDARDMREARKVFDSAGIKAIEARAKAAQLR